MTVAEKMIYFAILCCMIVTISMNVRAQQMSTRAPDDGCGGPKAITLQPGQAVAIGTIITNGENGVPEYRNNLDCNWTVTAPDNYVVRLTTTVLKTETNLDYLDVWDANSTKTPVTSYKLVNKISGGDINNPSYASKTSSQRHMFIQFISDGKVSNFLGFSGIVQAVAEHPRGGSGADAMCFGDASIDLNAQTGQLVIGTSGVKYPDNMLCSWTITAPVGKAVLLDMLSFNSDSGDTITIYNGKNSSAAKLSSFGSSSYVDNLPGDMITDLNYASGCGTQRYLHVIWKTDDSPTISQNGFRAAIEVSEPFICGDGIRHEREQCDTGSIGTGIGTAYAYTDLMGTDRKHEEAPCRNCKISGGGNGDIIGTSYCPINDVGSQSTCFVARCGNGRFETTQDIRDYNENYQPPPPATYPAEELCDFKLATEDGADKCDIATCTLKTPAQTTCTKDPLYKTDQSKWGTLCYDIGDGVREVGEGCDDGNYEDGDGCNMYGQVEQDYVCSGEVGETSQCNIYFGFCGDGIVTDPETCDDGNLHGGDGCSSTCKIERGWACKSSSSMFWTGKDGYIPDITSASMNSSLFRTDYDGCLNGCGDGATTSALGEQCDDGNQEDGDGCSNTCTLESGWICLKRPDGYDQANDKQAFLNNLTPKSFTSEKPNEQPPSHILEKSRVLCVTERDGWAQPSSKPLHVSFVDINPKDGEVEGILNLTAAPKPADFGGNLNSLDFTNYAIYWGHSPTKVLINEESGEPESVGNPSGIVEDGSLRYTMDINSMPDRAAYIIVRCRNDGKEGKNHIDAVSGVHTPFEDLILVPSTTAVDLVFTDRSLSQGSVSGLIAVQGSGSPNVTGFELHWGSSSGVCQKAGDNSLIGEVNRINITSQSLLDIKSTESEKLREQKAAKNSGGQSTIMQSSGGASIIEVSSPSPACGDCLMEPSQDCCKTFFPFADSPSPVCDCLLRPEDSCCADREDDDIIFGPGGSRRALLQATPSPVPFPAPSPSTTKITYPIGTLQVAETTIPEGADVILAFEKNQYGPSSNCMSKLYLDAFSASKYRLNSESCVSEDVSNRLVDNGICEGKAYGESLAIDGSIAIVGSPLDGTSLQNMWGNVTVPNYRDITGVGECGDGRIEINSMNTLEKCDGGCGSAGDTSCVPGCPTSVYMVEDMYSSYMQDECTVHPDYYCGQANDGSSVCAEINTPEETELRDQDEMRALRNRVPLGRAHIFLRSEEGPWTLLQSIESPARDSWQFGHAVAIKGHTAVITAPAYSSYTPEDTAGGNGGNAPLTESGAAFVYHFCDGQWKRIITLLPSQYGDRNLRFGETVSMNEDWILVGAPNYFAKDPMQHYNDKECSNGYLRDAEDERECDMGTNFFGAESPCISGGENNGNGNMPGAPPEPGSQPSQSPRCTQSKGYKCYTSPGHSSVCIKTSETCGDGVLQAETGEMCDHGASNGEASDDCDKYCQYRNVAGRLGVVYAFRIDTSDFAALCSAGTASAQGNARTIGKEDNETIYYPDEVLAPPKFASTENDFGWDDASMTDKEKPKFGYSIAMESDYVAIGAPWMNNTHGRVFLYSIAKQCVDVAPWNTSSCKAAVEQNECTVNGAAQACCMCGGGDGAITKKNNTHFNLMQAVGGKDNSWFGYSLDLITSEGDASEKIDSFPVVNGTKTTKITRLIVGSPSTACLDSKKSMVQCTETKRMWARKQNMIQSGSAFVYTLRTQSFSQTFDTSFPIISTGMEVNTSVANGTSHYHQMKWISCHDIPCDPRGQQRLIDSNSFASDSREGTPNFASAGCCVLFSPNPIPGDGFGASVSISDKNVAVGSPGDNELGKNSGSVFTYDLNIDEASGISTRVQSFDKLSSILDSQTKVASYAWSATIINRRNGKYRGFQPIEAGTRYFGGQTAMSGAFIAAGCTLFDPYSRMKTDWAMEAGYKVDKLSSEYPALFRSRSGRVHHKSASFVDAFLEGQESTAYIFDLSGCPASDEYYGVDSFACMSISLCPPGSYSMYLATKKPFLKRFATAAEVCSLTCPKGSFCIGGQKIACPSGRYADTTGSSMCKACPQGSYGASEGQSSSSCSGICPKGTFCPEASTKQFSCGGPSLYCPDGITQEQVPLGQYSINQGDKILYDLDSRRSRIGAKNCSIGSYCNAGSLKTCPVGRYGDEINLKSADACKPCKAGYYCPIFFSPDMEDVPVDEHIGSVKEDTLPCDELGKLVSIANGTREARYFDSLNMFIENKVEDALDNARPLELYCQEGGGVNGYPRLVQDGHYTNARCKGSDIFAAFDSVNGPSCEIEPGTATEEIVCDIGYWCKNGMRYKCSDSTECNVEGRSVMPVEKAPENLQIAYMDSFSMVVSWIAITSDTHSMSHYGYHIMWSSDKLSFDLNKKDSTYTCGEIFIDRTDSCEEGTQHSCLSQVIRDGRNLTSVTLNLTKQNIDGSPPASIFEQTLYFKVRLASDGGSGQFSAVHELAGAPTSLAEWASFKGCRRFPTRHYLQVRNISTGTTMPLYKWKCHPCPDGAFCPHDVTDRHIIARKGFWRPKRRANLPSLKFFKCIKNTPCLGVEVNATIGNSRLSFADPIGFSHPRSPDITLPFSSIENGSIISNRLNHDFKFNLTQDHKLLETILKYETCLKGTNLSAALCYVCEKDWTMTNSGACETCAEGSTGKIYMFLAVFSGIVVFCLLLLFYMNRKVARQREVQLRAKSLKLKLQHSVLKSKALSVVMKSAAEANDIKDRQAHDKMEDTVLASKLWLAEHIQKVKDVMSKMKIIVSFFQVGASMGSVFKIQYPKEVLDLQARLSVLTLDLYSAFNMGCLSSGYYARLLFTTLIPLVSMIAALVLYVACRFCKGLKDRDWRASTASSCVSFIMTVSFLVYPSISQKLFAYYQCIDLGSHGDQMSLLQGDLSVNCSSSEYKAFTPYVLFMMGVYPLGIPVMYAIMLFRSRKSLEEKDTAVRDDNESLDGLRFLFDQYGPHAWWFELFELLRKLILTSALMIMPGNLTQSAIGILVCYAYTVVVCRVQPYDDINDCTLQVFSQICLFLTLLGGILLKAASGSASTPAISVILMTIQVSVPIFAIFMFCLNIKQSLSTDKQKEDDEKWAKKKQKLIAKHEQKQKQKSVKRRIATSTSKIMPINNDPEVGDDKFTAPAEDLKIVPIGDDSVIGEGKPAVPEDELRTTEATSA